MNWNKIKTQVFYSFLIIFPPKNHLVLNRGRRLKRGGVENREGFSGGGRLKMDEKVENEWGRRLKRGGFENG